jgi:glycosyltransferase involved in cell wall biosynthesis
MTAIRVLVVSSSYPRLADDWRGRFIADLVSTLPQDDLAVRLWAPPGPLPERVVAATLEEERAWLDRLSQAGGIAARLRTGRVGAFTAAWGLLRRLWHVYRREHVDVVHVNWLQNALPLVGTRRPLVVGVLGSDYGLLRLPGMVSMLRSVFSARRTLIAPNAPWMVPRLTELFGAVAKIHAIPFGVTPALFDIKRRHTDSAPWLAVTRITRAKIGDLFRWGEGLFDERRPLVLLGPMQERMQLPSWVDYRGPTHPEALRREWFPQAAGLVTLSRHNEGRPQVLIEAMAAGLPMVVSDLPAHRDLVRNSENGWIVTSRDTLAAALADLSKSPRNRQAGESGRELARSEIGDWQSAAARFRAAYRTVCSA